MGFLFPCLAFGIAVDALSVMAEKTKLWFLGIG